MVTGCCAMGKEQIVISQYDFGTMWFKERQDAHIY